MRHCRTRSNRRAIPCCQPSRARARAGQSRGTKNSRRESRVLIHRNERARHVSERAGDRGERADDEHDTAGIDRSRNTTKRDEDVGERQRGAAHETGQHGDTRRRAIHLLALTEKLLGYLRVASEEIVRQQVRADLLGRTRLDEEVAEVLALPLLRRFPIEELVQPRGYAPLEQQRQHRGEERQHHQQPVQAREQRRPAPRPVWWRAYGWCVSSPRCSTAFRPAIHSRYWAPPRC